MFVNSSRLYLWYDFRYYLPETVAYDSLVHWIQGTLTSAAQVLHDKGSEDLLKNVQYRNLNLIPQVANVASNSK